jgi:hypothetical protein
MADTFRDRGTEVIDNAVALFYKRDKTAADALKAVQDLKDLQNALSAVQRRVREERANNERALPANMQKLLSNGISSEGAKFASDIRAPTDAMAGITRFVSDMAEAVGFFSCVAMSPDPLTASVVSVVPETLRQAKSHTEREGWTSDSQQADRHSSYAVSGRVGLFSSSYHESGARSSSVHQSSAAGSRAVDKRESLEYDRVPIDAEVMPMLLSLRDRLQEITALGGTDIVVSERSSGAGQPFTQAMQPARLWLPVEPGEAPPAVPSRLHISHYWSDHSIRVKEEF